MNPSPFTQRKPQHSLEAHPINVYRRSRAAQREYSDEWTPRPFYLTLSAKSEAALREVRRRMVEIFREAGRFFERRKAA